MKEKIIEIINSVLIESNIKLDETKSFTEQQIDSLDGMEFMLLIEDEFNIDIPDDDLQKLTNVQAIVDYVRSKNNG